MNGALIKCPEPDLGNPPNHISLCEWIEDFKRLYPSSVAGPLLLSWDALADCGLLKLVSRIEEKK